MKMIRTLVFALCSLAALCLLATPVAAQGQSGSTQQFIFDGSGVFNHPCGTELVECTGNTGIVIRNGENANGTRFFNIIFQDHGIECVGLESGNVYRSAFTQHITERNIDPFPDSCFESGCTATLTATWHLISQGPAANLKSQSLAQFTFSGQGVPILVNFTETTLSCE
jgi:hypothetical protein